MGPASRVPEKAEASPVGFVLVSRGTQPTRACVNRDLSYPRETALRSFLGAGSPADIGSAELWLLIRRCELLRSRLGCCSPCSGGGFHPSLEFSPLKSTHRALEGGSHALRPVDGTKTRPAPGDGAVPEVGTGRSRVSAPASPRCKASRGPGVRPSTQAGAQPYIKASLLFKGLLELPALLLFWCLRRATPPSSCISLLPSTCWGHAALPWPRQQLRAPLGSPAGFLGAPQGAASSPRGGCVPAFGLCSCVLPPRSICISPGLQSALRWLQGRK